MEFLKVYYISQKKNSVDDKIHKKYLACKELGLTVCILVTPKCIIQQTIQMKCRRCSISSESTLFAKSKIIFRDRNTILFGYYYWYPFDLYNGPSQAYCIEPEGRIH